MAWSRFLYISSVVKLASAFHSVDMTTKISKPRSFLAPSPGYCCCSFFFGSKMVFFTKQYCYWSRILRFSSYSIYWKNVVAFCLYFWDYFFYQNLSVSCPKEKKIISIYYLRLSSWINNYWFMEYDRSLWWLTSFFLINWKIWEFKGLVIDFSSIMNSADKIFFLRRNVEDHL